jgi:hypothetical protein
MRPETVPCPACKKTLLTEKVARYHVSIATTARHHATLHEIDCPSCRKRHGLITATEKKSYLLILVRPEKLKDEFTAVWQLMKQETKLSEVWRRLGKTAEAAVLGKRAGCRHAWRFRRVHPLGFLQLVCNRCGAEREEVITAVNLVEYVLKPYSQGDKFLRKEKEVIESAILPRKEEIIREAARELDQRLKMNARRRRRLRELMNALHTIALVT